MFLAKNVNKQVHSLAIDGKLTVGNKQWLFNVNEVKVANEWLPIPIALLFQTTTDNYWVNCSK